VNPDTDLYDPEPLYTIPPDLVIGSESVILPASGPANWGMPLFAVDALRGISRGDGIIAGIIDTGIDRNHPDIAANFLDAKDFTGSPSGYADRNGHGTHCSATVASSNPEIGVATGAKIVHGKGLSDGGSGGGSWIAAAMRWCVERGATVLSMSLGSPSRDPSIDEAGAELTAKGIWIVCAAGNSGGGTPNVDFPGRLPWAISVAALDSNRRVASFSSAGAKINTSGPGVGIWSAKPGGGYQQMSGTSMATPFVAGVLACYRGALVKLGRPVPSTADLLAELRSRSVDVEAPGFDNRTGPGAVSGIMLANALTPDPGPVSQ